MAKLIINKHEHDYQTREAYKVLRTNLQFCGADKKVIAFTSCTPNEGKSSVTMNLAMSIAETGKSVLLIDADLRNSVLLGRTEVNSNEEVLGLTHYLTKQVKLQDIICTTNIPKFHIICAGIVPPNPSELLGSLMFKEMIRILRGVYDYIIVDTPPLGLVIDTAVIVEYCDGAVIVIESENISCRFVQDVKEQLKKTNCPILGAVLNKVDYNKNAAYGKYGKYGKYGRYGKYGEYGKKGK